LKPEDFLCQLLDVHTKLLNIFINVYDRHLVRI
jgi:hypothetical protein